MDSMSSKAALSHATCDGLRDAVVTRSRTGGLTKPKLKPESRAGGAARGGLRLQGGARLRGGQ